MPLSFFASKNGSRSCEYDKIAFHSRYNPEHEAEMFVQNMSCGFHPKAVIVIEPALSYCAAFLRKKFPKAVLCAVRLRDDCDFSESDGLWNYVFKMPKNNDSTVLADEIYDCLGEEVLCATFSFSWQPSSRIFPKENEAAWTALKITTEKAKTVLYTRGFFSARWISNAVIFCKNAENFCSIKKGTLPVAIAASGPSLENAVEVLKKYRDNFFLVAVSSAVSTCHERGIMPDLCITTDGGFWAKRHFDFCEKNMCVAMPPEAAVPSSLFQSIDVLPLSYEDGMADMLLQKCGITPLHAERNGTVSGTAVMLALSLTCGNIFFCGLDLMPSASFQHTQPNLLEILNSANDFRVSNKETRNTKSRFVSTQSLEIYRAWFSALPDKLSKRIYRVGVDSKNNPPLGNICDIDAEVFEEKIKSSSGEKIIVSKSYISKTKEDRAKIIRIFLEQECGSSRFKHEFFPTEFVSMDRMIDEAEKMKMSQILDERCEKLYARLGRLI